MASNDRDIPVVYIIPPNYTDSGRLLGFVELRNAIEAVILILLIGYPELFIFNMSFTIRIVVMVVTLLPVGALACFGIEGDSLFEFLGHVIRFGLRRRVLHMRRVGYKYAPEQLKRKEAKGAKKQRSARK